MADGHSAFIPDIRTPEDLPADAPMIVVRPRRRDPVAAHLATSDGEVAGASGEPLHYAAGAHYIVQHAGEVVSVVRRDIFERTYRRVREGLYRKRSQLRLRAVVADREMRVQTLEGPRTARRGDWIMIGVADELWPVPATAAHDTYREAKAVSFSSVGVVVGLVFLLLAYVAVAAA
ncbi:MAG: hypothetical protein NW200_01080 [Hyphomonadaceae bacterium]|nr:hypothetical protein [Hyphomonadaceae bacterium]